MFAAVYVDGASAEVIEDAPDAVTVELCAEAAYRCRACGEALTDTIDGLCTDSGELMCPDYDPGLSPDPDPPDGPHDPEPVPLAWCNSAAVHVDESGDSVTVSISVGDPRGAFTFTVRRVPDDVAGALAGRLVLHVPHAEMAAAHMPLTALYSGTYLVGNPYKPGRSPWRRKRNSANTCGAWDGNPARHTTPNTTYLTSEWITHVRDIEPTHTHSTP
jgi:hypothetical protein